MKLFLIRHASAIEQMTTTVTTDDMRFISGQGRNIASNVFSALKKQLSGIEHIFTSPLIRAVQTAEILSSVIQYKGEIELVNELRNESSISSILTLLERNGALNQIAFVGHEPKMSILSATLCGNFTATEGFAKCGVALLDYSPSTYKGEFKGYFDPVKLILRS